MLHRWESYFRVAFIAGLRPLASADAVFRGRIQNEMVICIFIFSCPQWLCL